MPTSAELAPLGGRRHLAYLVLLFQILTSVPGIIAGALVVGMAFDVVVMNSFADFAIPMVLGGLVHTVGLSLLTGRWLVGSGGWPVTRRETAMECTMYFLLGAAGGIVVIGSEFISDAQWPPVHFFLSFVVLVVAAFLVPGALRDKWDGQTRALHASPGTHPAHATAEGTCESLITITRGIRILTVSFTDRQGALHRFRFTSGRWAQRISPLLITYRTADPRRVVHVCDVAPPTTNQ